jgi:acyltransferase
MKNIKSTNVKRRFYWIDIARAIGIQFVLIGHINNPLQPFIYSWHMPFFFIIAGLVIDINAKFHSTIIKDARRLLLPFFIFTIVALIVELPKRIILQREVLNYTEKISNILVWWDYESLSGTYAFVLWFLPTLFFAKYFTISILKFSSHRVLQFLVLIFCFVIGYNCNLPFALDEALIATVFVYAGNSLFTLYINFNSIGLIRIFITILSILAIFSYFKFGIPVIDVAGKKFLPLMYSLFWSIILSMLVLGLCIFLSSFYWHLLFFINGGMTFYIIHPYTHNISDQLRQFVNIDHWIFTYLASLCMLFIIHSAWFRFSRAILNNAKF